MGGNIINGSNFTLENGNGSEIIGEHFNIRSEFAVQNRNGGVIWVNIY